MFHFLDKLGLTQTTRHKILQALFWNQHGAKAIRCIQSLEHLLSTVGANYSLINHSNGENWFPSLLPPQSLVVDVGFFEGDFTSQVLRVHPNTEILALDPTDSARDHYEENFSKYKNVNFRQIAASDSTGQQKFFDYDNMCNSLSQRADADSSPVDTYNVPTDTLDNLLEGYNSRKKTWFLKVDAEGHDLTVLKGAESHLSQQKIDMLMFEFGPAWVNSGNYLLNAVRYLETLPFTLYRLFDGFLNEFSYSPEIDSCTLRPAMYVAVSDNMKSSMQVPIRNLNL